MREILDFVFPQLVKIQVSCHKRQVEEILLRVRKLDFTQQLNIHRTHTEFKSEND